VGFRESIFNPRSRVLPLAGLLLAGLLVAPGCRRTAGEVYPVPAAPIPQAAAGAEAETEETAVEPPREAPPQEAPAVDETPPREGAPPEYSLAPVPPPAAPEASPEPGSGLADGTVFGRPVYGLNPEMLRRLRRAEEAAAAKLGPLPAGAPPENRWGVDTIAGYRRGSRYHRQGLAVDINYFANPYVMHERGEPPRLDRELGPVYHRIARLMLGRDSVIPGGINRGAPAEARTLRLFEQLREESRAMIGYFRLMQDRGNSWWRELLPGDPDPAPETLQRQMLRDYVTLAGRPGPGGPGLEYPEPARLPAVDGDRPFAGEPRYRAPEWGFLKLRKELVASLLQVGVRWGGTDMGGSSGDLMHFYLPGSELAPRAPAGELFRRPPASPRD
jgi:hypothetical protein